MSFSAFVEYEAGRLLKQCGAVINDDHFVYASGRHGAAYVDKNAVLNDPERLKALCGLIVCIFSGVHYDVVIGPESGGVKIADGVVASIRDDNSGNSREVRAFHAMKTGDGGFVLPHEPHAIHGRKVLVVEDVLTTGGSCRKVVDLVQNLGGEVVGVAAFVNRGAVSAETLGSVPTLVSLVMLQLQSWEEQECPLCEAGVPVRTDLGKGKAFVERKQQKAP